VAAARSHVHVDDLLPKTFHGCFPASLGDYVRASQACLPKLNFPCFLEKILSCGSSVVKTTLTCMLWSLLCGSTSC
jgi:hypothetical protein